MPGRCHHIYEGVFASEGAPLVTWLTCRYCGDKRRYVADRKDASWRDDPRLQHERRPR